MFVPSALLAMTADLDGEARRIGWREAVALAQNGSVPKTFIAEGAPGILAREYDPGMIAAGGGFWIPALWICPEIGGKRLAELTPEERAGREDHWAMLGRAMRAYLRSIDDELK